MSPQVSSHSRLTLVLEFACRVVFNTSRLVWLWGTLGGRDTSAGLVLES